MDIYEKSLNLHKKLVGKLKVESKKPIKGKEDLSLLYTPGVAEPSRVISKDRKLAYKYTGKGNTVAVITDGSAVLGLGDIGPEAALPVIEGKCALLKDFGGVDAYPIVLNTKDSDEIISIVKALAPGFGGINLEDISAPRCFEIEQKLQNIGIPVFHDDQHGTAIVVLAALINSLKVVGKKIEAVKIVILGAGAAGIAISKILKPKSLVLIDSKGTITLDRKDINKYKKQVASQANYCQTSSLEEAFEKADVFIGVSGRGEIDAPLIKKMSKDAIIFALSNPKPEIMPKEAKKAGGKVVATGRSDFPNQINNVLVFPGIFRGALNSRAEKIGKNSMLRAAQNLAAIIEKPSTENILPSPFDKKVVEAVSRAVYTS